MLVPSIRLTCGARCAGVSVESSVDVLCSCVHCTSDGITLGDSMHRDIGIDFTHDYHTKCMTIDLHEPHCSFCKLMQTPTHAQNICEKAAMQGGRLKLTCQVLL